MQSPLLKSKQFLLAEIERSVGITIVTTTKNPRKFEIQYRAKSKGDNSK